MKKIPAFIRQIPMFFLSISNDLLVLAGIIVIIWTNFRVHFYFGMYSLGVVLIVAGLGLTRMLRKVNQK